MTGPRTGVHLESQYVVNSLFGSSTHGWAHQLGCPQLSCRAHVKQQQFNLEFTAFEVILKTIQGGEYIPYGCCRYEPKSSNCFHLVNRVVPYLFIEQNSSSIKIQFWLAAKCQEKNQNLKKFSDAYLPEKCQANLKWVSSGWQYETTEIQITPEAERNLRNLSYFSDYSLPSLNISPKSQLLPLHFLSSTGHIHPKLRK